MTDSGMKSRTLFYWISTFLLFVLAVSSIFSPIRALPFFNQLWALFFLGWFLFTILDNPGFVFNDHAHRLAIYIYVIYTIFVANLTGNGMIGNRFFELSQLPLFYIAYQNNKRLGRDGVSRKIIYAIIPFLLYTCFITIKACLENPVTSREIKKNAEGFAMMREGIGGYELIYFLVIFFAILLFVGFNTQKKIKFHHKLFILFLLVLFAATIILSNFLTALMLVTISIVAKVFLSNITVNKIILVPIIAMVILTYVKNLLVIIIDFVSGFIVEGMNATRLLELRLFLMKNESGAAMNARATDFNESINLFLENPIFGILTKPLLTIGDGVTGFGQHSQMFDTFALYGIGIGLLQLYIYTQPFIKRLKTKDGNISSFAFTIMFVLMILITINNATPSIGFAAFFIFPVIYDWIHNESEIT